LQTFLYNGLIKRVLLHPFKSTQLRVNYKNKINLQKFSLSAA